MVSITVPKTVGESSSLSASAKCWRGRAAQVKACKTLDVGSIPTANSEIFHHSQEANIMSGKEIKNYVLNQNDTEYTVMILNNDGERVSYNAIKDDVMYNFKKIDEIQIGAGMFVAQYLIERK